jgi:Holliday junction resolvase RusA-like endonuclease
MSISFIVYGEPVAKGRPRYTKSGHCYTPAKTAKWEANVACLARRAKGSQFFDGPVNMRLSFIFGMPKNWPKGKRELWEGLPCTKKPDLDNVVKLVLDALNNAGVWADDSYVTDLSTRKVWGVEPRTEIIIEALPK